MCFDLNSLILDLPPTQDASVNEGSGWDSLLIVVTGILGVNLPIYRDNWQLFPKISCLGVWQFDELNLEEFKHLPDSLTFPYTHRMNGTG